jgi:serine protease SohB
MFWNFTRRKSLVSVTNLNDIYADTINDVNVALGGKIKDIFRSKSKKKIFVIDFDGDTMATQAKALSYEVTSVICNASEGDEVLVRINTGGGAAHAYGYASSQLTRIKNAGIPLTVSVDKIAASGGYMMACVGDKIISAPWAIIGSIGVVSELPNFFNFLKNLGIDYKQYTAGEFKRTISMMGPITEEGEKKFEEDLFDVYDLFCNHVATNRPILAPEIKSIATGEHWQGMVALELNLVDEIKTSDEYILENLKSAEVMKVTYVGDRKTFAEKLGASMAFAIGTGFFKAMYESFAKVAINSRYNK